MQGCFNGPRKLAAGQYAFTRFRRSWFRLRTKTESRIFSPLHGQVRSVPIRRWCRFRCARKDIPIIVLKRQGEFVINLTTKELTKAADFCGVRSGRDVDKFAEMNLTPWPGQKVSVPQIAESPVSLECRVTQKIELGTTRCLWQRSFRSVWTRSGWMKRDGFIWKKGPDRVLPRHILRTWGSNWDVRLQRSQKEKKKR